jgi:ribosome-associated translation inhibitor RaiA
MFIQVKAGNDTHADENWKSEIAGIVEGTLSRFDDRLTSVEVYISDENSREKDGNNDKRCLIEARLAGLQPIAVRSHADSFEEAIADCAEKIERTLDKRLGRLADKDGRVSQSGDGMTEPPQGML